MEIVVPDVVAELAPLYLSRDPPRIVLRRAMATIGSGRGPFAPPGLTKEGRAAAIFETRKAVLIDGYEAIYGQQAFGLFNPSRRREASDWEFDRYAESRLLARMKEVL